MTKKIYFCLLTLLASSFFSCRHVDADFTIDYENDTFLMDGKPFRYISGSAHYFRMPHQYWRDRLRKLRAAGLNAVSTYIEWRLHEPAPGQYDFTGDNNITEYFQIAQEEGLYVLVRPGPYVCAERENGGFPPWLLNDPNIYLRSSNAQYLEQVRKWIGVLMPVVQPYLYGNGGPIILVQAENEYGHYGCDAKYKAWLKDAFAAYVQDKAILYTTDKASALNCGAIDGIFPTVDFGPGTNVTDAFGTLRQRLPKGPLVNSEFYPGWFTFWGQNLAHRRLSDTLTTLQEIMDWGANVNFYMFFGGTNFGFTAGATGSDQSYQSVLTSYDYGAPISESGDLTDNYYAFRDFIGKYLPLPDINVTTAEKGDYGDLTLEPAATLFSPKIRSLGAFNQNRYPETFESLGQNYGYLLYETAISVSASSTDQDLVLEQIHDFASIYLNGEFLDVLSREAKNDTIKLPPVDEGDRLSILVENRGRINSGKYNNERKGLLSNVTLGGKILESWRMTSLELKDVKIIEDCKFINPECNNGEGFVFYAGKLSIESDFLSEEGYPLDSFLDVSGLTKGLVFVNGHNLGRYWSTRKPQKTLYVPGVYLNLHPTPNIFLVLDENIKTDSLTLSFSKTPIFSNE